jgi:CIC family chloride channel protein
LTIINHSLKAFLEPLRNRLRSSETTIGVTLSIVVGVGAGFGALIFWKAIEYCSWLFFKGGASAFGFLGDYYVIVLPAIGGLIIGPIIYFFAREARGEGPPEVMEAFSVGRGRIRQRIAVAKVLVSSICIGSGGSVGREGPIIQIGASIGSLVGQRLKLSDEWVKTLLLCGAAGGISATFNAPIAGAFFACEVLQRKFMARNVIFIIISSVAADIISRVFLYTEQRPYVFAAMPDYTLQSPWEILLYVLLGIIIGVVVYAFIKFFYKSDSLFHNLKLPQYLKPALGGLIIGLIGYFYPDIFGVGYGVHYTAGGILTGTGGLDKALMGDLTVGVLLALLALKIIASSVTLGSGGSGGVFAPSLFIGAMLGGAFGIGAHLLFPSVTATTGAYALVGMGAFFGAAVGGPITAIIIVFEITQNYMVILPLIAAVAFSTLVYRRFTSESIYTMRLLERGIDVNQPEETDILKNITIGEVMTQDFPTVSTEMPVTKLVRMLEKTGHHGCPVLSKGDKFYGVVTIHDVEEGLKSGTPHLKVQDIATANPVIAYPDESVYVILRKLGAMDVGRIPVVSRDDPQRLVGVLRRHDIIRAYSKAAAEAKKWRRLV